MSDLLIPLSSPVTVTVREGGTDIEKQVSNLEMREPVLSDFAAVSVNEPTIGQMIGVASLCCTNLPAAKFKALSASNMMAVAGWVGGFLHGSR